MIKWLNHPHTSGATVYLHLEDSESHMAVGVWHAGRPESPLSDSEDENPEALQEAHTSRALSHYGLCEQPQPDLLLPATPPPSPRHLHTSHAVVISQPAPLCSPHQPSSDTHTHSSESVRLVDQLSVVLFL